MDATFWLLISVCWIYIQKLLLFFFRATARRLVTLLVTQHEKFSIPMLPVATLAKKPTTVCWVRFATFASCCLPTNPKRGPNEANRKFIIIQRKTLSRFHLQNGSNHHPPIFKDTETVGWRGTFSRVYTVGSSKFFIFLLLFLGWVDRVRDAQKMKRMPPPP